MEFQKDNHFFLWNFEQHYNYQENVEKTNLNCLILSFKSRDFENSESTPPEKETPYRK